MKKIFIAESSKHKQAFAEVVKSITEAVMVAGFEPIVFINSYQLRDNNFKHMMDSALKEISESACLIAELSNKALGIGIEMGFAKAQGKTIIVLRNQQSEISTTAQGIVDYYFSYQNSDDIKKLLLPILQSIK